MPAALLLFVLVARAGAAAPRAGTAPAQLSLPFASPAAPIASAGAAALPTPGGGLFAGKGIYERRGVGLLAATPFSPPSRYRAGSPSCAWRPRAAST